MKYLLIITVIVSQASFCFTIYCMNFLDGMNSQFITILMHVFYLISIIAYLFIFYRFLKNIKYKEEEKQLKQLKEIKEKQKKSMELFISKEQENKEKIIKQIDKVIEEIDHGEYDQAKEVFLHVYDDFKSHSMKAYCNNAYLNAIITNKKNVMDEHQIRFNCSILLPENINLDVLVLPTLIFNLLDNGINACGDAEDKFIDLDVKYTSTYISIHMKNTNSHINREGIEGMHGYGISIIEDLIKKHEGSYEWNDLGDIYESILMLKY